MFEVSATRTSGGWQLARIRLRKSIVADVGAEQAAMASGRRRVRGLLCDGPTPPSSWLLEFCKAMLGSGELALGQAEALAELCATQASKTHRVLDRSGCLQLRTVADAFRRRGLVVVDGPGKQISNMIVFCLAGCAAYLVLVTTLLRSTFERNVAKVKGKALVAVHGELSNRTRHVLLAFTSELKATTVLVLGRPKVSLAKLRQQWAEDLGTPVINLVRPFSVLDGIAALPASVRSLCVGARLARKMPWLPNLGGQTGIIYRELLGQVSSRWWVRSGVRDADVVYGHTGLADTTGLELAQQSVGCRTIHAVHGVSDGTNFVGRSNLAVFRCGHDARWHAALGGYGECVSLPLNMPEFRQPGHGVLTLSNYIHPMNLWFQLDKERGEVELLGAVSGALEASSAQAGARAWRPHPIIIEQLASIRDRVVSEAVSLGFSPWIGGRDISAAADFALVLCTPSSALLDMLALGVSPILLDWQQTDPETAVAQVVDIARSQQELVEIIAESGIAAKREAAYRSAWQAIEPAAPLDLKSLLRG